MVLPGADSEGDLKLGPGLTARNEMQLAMKRQKQEKKRKRKMDAVQRS